MAMKKMIKLVFLSTSLALAQQTGEGEAAVGASEATNTALVDKEEAESSVPVPECKVFAHFSKLDSHCCNLNLDCRSICCVDHICIASSTCPTYDGSIDAWEREQLNL